MRARVATFEGEVRGPEYDEQIEEIRSETESGNRPPGLEDAKGVLILSGESGKRIAITLFDDEEGMRRGDAALNEMTPVGMGTRSSVEFYEVAVLDMSWGPASGKRGKIVWPKYGVEVALGLSDFEKLINADAPSAFRDS